MDKKYIILLTLFLFIAVTSCQKSEFSTTTRHSNKGKVSYSYRHNTEWKKNSKMNSHKKQSRNSALAEDSAPGYKDFVASASGEPVLPVKRNELINMVQPLEDSLKPATQTNEKISKNTYYKVLKYKNGHKERVRILSQSRDSLKYKLEKESGVVRYVAMEQIDSILPDTRKAEPLSVTSFGLSVLGVIPLILTIFIGFGPITMIGFPLAAVAVVLGLIGLRRIKRKSDRYKGKGFAQVGIVLGIITFVAIIIIAWATAISSCSAIEFHI